jgi:hypothetical protein
LDAADRDSVVLSGSNVTQWNDKSGNLRNGTPVNSLTYSAASNAVVFTRSSSQYLTLPDNTFPIGSSSFSIFFVFTPTATSYEIQLITAGARGGNIFGIRSGNAGTGTLQTFWSGNNDIQTSNLWARGQRNIGALLHQVGGTRSLWINGVQGASDTPGAQTAITTSNCIGTLAPGAFNTFDGQMHEVLVFESSLSVTERQQVESYLAQRWDPAPSPLSVPGCVFWLDAGDRSTLTLSASNTITAWTEKSGANRTVTTNSTGIYSATAMNGRPGIQFSAGNVMTSSTAATLGNNLTVFAVFMATSEGPRQLNVPIFVGSSANGYWLTYRGDFQIYQARQEGGAQTANSYFRSINLPVIMAGVASATASQQNAFLNGYSTDVVNSAPLSNVGATTIYIPGGEPYWGGPANGMFNGVISEILLFSNALTTTQRQTIEGYLSSKWGISVNVKPTFLPSTHAFPRAPPPVRPFSPLDVDGIAFWLDAADPATLTLSGSNITQWRDKSSNAFAGTAVSSPTLQSNSINGLSAVQFNGSSQYITFGNVLNLGTSPVSVFAVTRFTGNAGIVGKVSSRWFSGRWGLYRFASDGGLVWYADASPSGANIVYADTKVADTTTTTQLLQGSWDRSTLSLTQNGTQRSSNTFVNTSNLSNTDNLLVGGYADGDGTGIRSDFFLNGVIGEILVYLGALTVSQRQQVETYLADKWGLRGSMGGTPHPHRFGPPMILPTQFSGCRMWLDAADATTLTLSGSNVTQWRDKSEVGIHHIQTTASNQPTYGTDSVYGKPGILFNGTSTFLTQSNTSLFPISNTNTYSIFTAHRVSSNSANIHTIYRGATPVQRQWFRWQSTFANFLADRDPEGYINFASNNVGAMNGTSSFVNDTTTSSGYINGSLIATVSKTSSAISQYLSVGGVAGELMNGSIFEVIVFNRVVTATERQQIEGYLAWKWGLQGSLPGSVNPFVRVKRALTPVFVPNQIPGCALWLDAADTTTLTLSGSNVTAWRDKSGNGHIGTAVASPVLTTVDGVPAVTFNGSSQYIDFGTAGSLGSNQFHIFTVSKFNTTADGAIFARVANAGDQYYRYTMLRAGGVMYLATQADTGGYGQSVPVTDTTTTRRLLSYSWDRSTITGYQNGTVAGSVSYASTATYTSSFKLLVAAYNNSSGGTPPSDGFYMNGSINEILFYFGPLTTSQRQRVEGYLAEKWGLRGSLGGVNHPSRFGPPMILPTQIAGCSLWLDAADATTLTLSGSNVTQWRDKSGQGNNGSNTGTVSLSTFNSGQMISFNGDSVIQGSYTNSGTTITCFGIFVPQQSSYDNTRVVSFATAPGVLDYNNIGSLGAIVLDAGRTVYTQRNSAQLTTTTTFTTGALTMASLVYTGSSRQVFLNGGGQGSDSFSGSFGTTLYGIGAYAGFNPSSYAFNKYTGLVGEVIVYNSALSTAQRQQVEGYLAWKWGIQQSLPSSSHPYKVFKP